MAKVSLASRALVGISGLAVALGVGELTATNPRSSPVVVVGGAVIDAAPAWGKRLAIALFGTGDKIALQVGMLVILAVAFGALGIARRRWLPAAGFALLGLAGVAAALTRAGAGAGWAVPTICAAVSGAGVSWWLGHRLDRSATDVGGVGAAAGAPGGRRGFLVLAWSLVAGGVVAGWLGRYTGQRRGVEARRSEVALPKPSGRPATAPEGADVAGLSYVTPNSTFYRIDTAISAPVIDPDGWSLRIHGRVGRPYTLTFAQLLDHPMIERYVTLTCVSNDVGGDLIGNAKWLGVPVQDLLLAAEPAAGADQVVSRSIDGFTAGTPTAALLDGRDALVAVAMNGEALPIEHGFPARLVVPGLYGYVSATKWLTELELTTFADFDAYWVPRGWAQQAPIKTQSRIDRPRDGASLPAGATVIAGTAWAQHRGVSAVEVRIDNGPWRPAQLAATASVDTWRLWSLTEALSVGHHTITVRAVDNAGSAQPGGNRPPAPDGAEGWHSVTVDVR